MLFKTWYMNSQNNTNLNLKIFFLILSASLRLSTFFELRAISDRNLIISKNLSLTAVICIYPIRPSCRI
jgi:hypothetical protein